MMTRLPFSAPGTPPDTGASMSPMPCAASRAANARAESGAMLEKSTTRLPGRAAAATPCMPNSTASTAAWSVRHIMTMSDCRATSAGEAATRAPRASTGASLSGVRFHTVTSWPAASSRSVMGRPMRPIPR